MSKLSRLVLDRTIIVTNNVKVYSNVNRCEESDWSCCKSFIMIILLTFTLYFMHMMYDVDFEFDP